MKKVLVIDDDHDILSAVELILETHGFEAIVSTSGKEVFQIVEEYQPDLIILDYLLSGDDGSELCLHLKQSPTSKNIPVILFSANPSAENLVSKCGANSFISKPFTVSDILEQIQQHIQPSNSA